MEEINLYQLRLLGTIPTLRSCIQRALRPMTIPSLLPFPRWDDARAAALDEPGRLLYRSNLLGSDLRITNYGGGNTSAKIMQVDPLTGAQTEVLWVKGSGGDRKSVV